MTNEYADWIEPIVVCDAPVNNTLCHAAGFAVLLANRVRYAALGYRTPRPFDTSQIETAVNYDVSVVDQWLEWLSAYSPGTQITGRNILELGPGGDLGVGLILLAMGAATYNALDVNELALSAPDELYEALFAALSRRGVPSATTQELRSQLQRTRDGDNDRLNYVIRDDFDIGIFRARKIDLVLSQAAFEHFDNIEVTFRRLSETVRPGCEMVAEVDLSTHTRWFRDHDPLNIYRYPSKTYEPLRFRGAPNRVTPPQYRNYLSQGGWKDVCTAPVRIAGPEYLRSVTPHLSDEFQGADQEIGSLSICLCGTKY